MSTTGDVPSTFTSWLTPATCILRFNVTDLSSAGIAIARHTVYAAEAGYVVAYGL